MGKAAVLLAGAAAACFMYGCTCECEVECTESGQTRTVRMVEMKRSECNDLNDVGSDSCRYRCADR